MNVLFVIINNEKGTLFNYECMADLECAGYFFHILEPWFIFDGDFDVSEPFFTFNCPERSEENFEIY